MDTETTELKEVTEMAQDILFRYLQKDVEITLKIMDVVQTFHKSIEVTICLGDFVYVSVQNVVDLETPGLAHRIFTNMVNDFIHKFLRYAAKKV